MRIYAGLRGAVAVGGGTGGPLPKAELALSMEFLHLGFPGVAEGIRMYTGRFLRVNAC